MATLINFNMKKEQLQRIADDLNENGYVSVTVELRDQMSQFGKNASMTNGKKGDEKVYYANGKVTWTDGKVTVAPKEKESAPKTGTKNEKLGDLPF